MKRIFIALLGLLLSPQVISDEIIFKCKPNGYEEFIAVQIINIEENYLKFGNMEYEIIELNNNYITAIKFSKKQEFPGGEIWVQNRFTGEYKRGGVGQSCDQKGLNCTLEAETYKGVCKTRLF